MTRYPAFYIFPHGKVITIIMIIKLKRREKGSEERGLANLFGEKREKITYHFIKSSSMPPAVVTRTSTILFLARKRRDSRTPQLIMLDVYPTKILHFTFSRFSISSAREAEVEEKAWAEAEEKAEKQDKN